MSFEYLDSLSGAAKARYLKKLGLLGFGNGDCPYKLPGGSWVQDPTKWPDMAYSDLYHYLIESPGELKMKVAVVIIKNSV